MEPSERRERFGAYLPVIQRDTVLKFYDETGLRPPPENQEPITDVYKAMDSITINRANQLNEFGMKPHQILSELAISLFSELADSNRELVVAVNDGMEKSTFVTEWTSGMGVVLRLFQIQTEYELIDRMNKIKDIESIRDQIKVYSQSAIGGALDQVLSLPSIPSQQISLKQVIGAIKHSVMAPGQFENGAKMMYGLLTRTWPLLQDEQPRPILDQ